MPAPALVLDFGGSVAGYATLGPARSRGLSARGEIYELYLAPEYQGIGLGRRLFSAACSDLARRGLAPVLVWVLADNQPARGFYERLGGRPIAVGDERLGGTRLSKIAYLFEVAAARR
jgi:ribosomal protein S18 acetylase RimI-like enzyme